MIFRGKQFHNVGPKNRILYFCRVNLRAVMCTQCRFLVSYESKSVFLANILQKWSGNRPFILVWYGKTRGECWWRTQRRRFQHWDAACCWRRDTVASGTWHQWRHWRRLSVSNSTVLTCVVHKVVSSEITGHFVQKFSRNLKINFWKFSLLIKPPVLWPIYRSTCISRQLQLRTWWFCWCRVLLPACPCWWQPAHSD